MEKKLLDLIINYYETEKTKDFLLAIEKYYKNKNKRVLYYVENDELKEIYYNDKALREIVISRKEEKQTKIIVEDENGYIFCFYNDVVDIAIKVFKEEFNKVQINKIIKDFNYIAYVIDKISQVKYYRVNAFISPFFYEISRVLSKNLDINIALFNFVQLFEDIFGVRIVRIENKDKIYFYRELYNEETFEIENENIRVKYVLGRSIDNSIELDKVFKIALFVLNTYFEAKHLETKQKEILEYHMVSKENLEKLNRLLEKSLYKMTFISSLYKKLSKIKNIKEALEMVKVFLKNEVGYEYIKINCGEDYIEDGIFNENLKVDEFEDVLIDSSLKYKISVYKTEITNEDNVYIGLIFNNSKVELENIILYKKLEELAIKDGLTGLYLHRYFMEILEKEIAISNRYCKELSLIMCDVDNFKKYNDTYGHLEGDKALKDVANVIKEAVRKSDVPCRYGGEEFIIILPHTALENGENLAQRIRKEVEEKTRVTLSIGVVEYKKMENRNEFIKRADDAMYLAKKTGKNKVVVG